MVVSDADAEALRKAGLTLKEHEGKPCIKFKRKVARKDGEQNPKPRIVDADNMPFDGLVGNGSKVNVQYRIWDWSYAGRSGVSADLQGVQVIDLVAFGGSEFKPVNQEEQAPVSNNNDDFDGDAPFDDE